MRSQNNGIELYISRFEAGLENDAPAYFDQEDYQTIVEHYLEIGNTTKADQACSMALAVHPLSVDLMVIFGKIANSKGNTQRALDAANKALEIQPTHPEGLLLLVQTGLTDQNVEHLINFLENCTTHSEDPDIIYLALGLAYCFYKDIPKGISQIKEAIRINAKNDQAWHTLTDIIVRHRRIKPHIPFYKSQIDKDPYNYTAWFYLGQCYNQLQEFGLAAEAFDYCTVIEETLPEGWFMKGAAMMNHKLFRDAIICLEQALVLQPKNQEAQLYLAACYEQLKDWEKAISAFKLILSGDKNCADAWHGVGSCMLAQDRNFEAIHWFNKALQLDKSKATYWYGLAQAEYRMGNIVSSQEAFEEACNCDPENAEIYLDWSFLYYDCGDFERAISLITSGIEELPDDANLYYRAVVYFLGQGSYREALNYLEKALLLDFEGHTTLYDFFEELPAQKALFKIIEQYRPQKEN